MAETSELSAPDPERDPEVIAARIKQFLNSPKDDAYVERVCRTKNLADVKSVARSVWKTDQKGQVRTTKAILFTILVERLPDLKHQRGVLTAPPQPQSIRQLPRRD